MFDNKNVYDSKVNINTLIVWQIDRCQQALSASAGDMYIAAVDALSITTSYLFDKSYLDEMILAQNKYDISMSEYKLKYGENFSTQSHIKQTQEYILKTINTDLAKRKQSAIMKLIHRKGLLPTSATEDSDVEETDESDEDDGSTTDSE
jgi:hypothetical protein